MWTLLEDQYFHVLWLLEGRGPGTGIELEKAYWDL